MASNEATGSSYFDLHAALAEETLMPAKLIHGAAKIAPSLDPATGTPDLEAEHPLDIPLWMLKGLLRQQSAEARCAAFVC